MFLRIVQNIPIWVSSEPGTWILRTGTWKLGYWDIGILGKVEKVRGLRGGRET